MDVLRRIDSAWARCEGWLAVAVLILMVLIAGFAAVVRNLTRFDIAWANALLNDMEWADSLLRKATLWLAFLGASLATRSGKHINIDVLLRLSPPRPRYAMLAASHLIAGLISVGLTWSFAAAVYLNLTERPMEYELLGADAPLHVCDASAQELAAVPDADRPSAFCTLRSALSLLGIPAEAPGAAFQLIVPLMLCVIALRLTAQGIGYTLTLLGGVRAIERAERAAGAAIERGGGP